MGIPRIVTVTKNGSNPAYRGARSGVDRLAKLRNVQVQHLTPIVDDSIPEQIGFLDALLGDKPDALLISAAHESALDPALERLRAAGVPVVMFVGRTTRRDLADCFIGSNDRAMTKAVAEFVATRAGGKGRVLILDGNPLGILYEARAAGFRDGLAEFSGMHLLAARDGDFLRAPGRVAMDALLDTHGEPDVVLVANDFMGLGALDALRARQMRPLVGSVNATPEGIAALRSGDMVATAAFNAMGMGCLALEAALHLLRGSPVPEQVLLPAEVVTIDNLAEWDLPYDQRPLPDWEQAVAHQGNAVIAA